MLEWYRANEPYERLMEDCAILLRLAAGAAGAGTLTYGSRSADPFAAPERVTVAEAFSLFAGIDLLATLNGPRLRGIRDPARRTAAATRRHQDRARRHLGRHLQPHPGREDRAHIGNGRATLLTEYPAAQAALARRNAADSRVAERFELYACGVELANAFGELTDPQEQRRRFELEMAEKQRIYGERYPIDEDFLAALAHMPPASGAALGFDRLVMLATGARISSRGSGRPLPD